jgi:hypothetical protein
MPYETHKHKLRVKWIVPNVGTCVIYGCQQDYKSEALAEIAKLFRDWFENNTDIKYIKNWMWECEMH